MWLDLAGLLDRMIGEEKCRLRIFIRMDSSIQKTGRLHFNVERPVLYQPDLIRAYMLQIAIQKCSQL